MGHDGPPENYYDVNQVTGEPLLECPVMTLIKAPPDLLAELVRMEQEDYPLFQQGFLKIDGGIADQPNRWLAWMRAIGQMRNASQAAFDRVNAPKE